MVVDLLDVLGVTENSMCSADRPVQCLVFGFQGTCGHACKSRGGTKLNEVLKVERSEEEVLRFDPTNRQSKLVSKELHEDDVCELLVVFAAGPFIFLLFLEDFVEAG